MTSRLLTGLILLGLFIGSLLAIFEPWNKTSAPIKLGLDLQGGLRQTLKVVNPSKDSAQALDDLNRARTIIENRINGLGVAEPLVQIQGGDRIVVELPGLKSDEKGRVNDILNRTAKLEFKILKRDAKPGQTTSQINEVLANSGLKGDELNKRRIELEKDLYKDTDFEVLPATQMVTGADLKTATVQNDQYGRNSVGFELKPEGAKKFGSLTSNHISRALAIILDDKPYSIANIQSQITNQGQITGQFSLIEASDLALVLRSGALPVKLEIAETRDIGPTLGQDAIHAGVIAGLIGIALLFVLIFFYYGFWLGLVAAFGLIYTIVLMAASIKLLGATLTLPGIAGLILTLGAAVDGNVLSFERIKEELKNGKSLRRAIPAGFSHSITTILDVNFCHLLAALALYQYSSGPVKGFAIMLALGVVVSVFSNLIFSRWALDVLGERKEIHPPYWLWGTKIDFMSAAKYVTWASIALAIISAGYIFSKQDKAFNFGVDFTGGTSYTLRAPQGMLSENIRSFLDNADIEGASGAESSISTLGSKTGNEFSVRIRQLSEPLRIELEKKLTSDLKVQVLQSESVGPAIGAELRKATIMATLVGLGLILAFMAFRFDWVFGLAAVIAVAHDVAIVAGLYSFLGLEFGIPTVAVLLTIVGFSLNDSVIISDRIRENLKEMRGASYRDIVNTSINQTLSRTLMTALATMLPLFALLFLGGPVLRDFSLTTLVGFIIGTYSSIFVVSALVVWYKTRERNSRSLANSA